MTVSGVFRDPADGYSVSAATRARVEAAAASLGYRPSSVARAMRSRYFHNIGLFALKGPKWIQLFPSSFAGIFDVLTEKSYHLTLTSLPPDTDPSLGRLPKAFAEECIDALIVDTTLGVPRETRRLVAAAAFPTVYLNHRDKVNAVYIEDENAATEATRYLLKKGYKRIGFFSFNSRLRDEHYSFEERRRAYFNAMSAAGLPAFEHSPPDHGFDAAAEMLTGKPKPEAYVCYSDNDAIYLQRATTALGMRIPDDLAIVTFQGHAYGFSPVPLTMMLNPWYDMGRAAAEMAIKAGQIGKRAEIPAQAFAATLQVGKSA